MTTLTQERCVACRKDSPRVTDEEIAELKPQVPEWNIVVHHEIPRLERTFRFKNFAQALEFTNKVGALAEEEGHHPVILIEYGRASVFWWCPSITLMECINYPQHYNAAEPFSPQEEGVRTIAQFRLWFGSSARFSAVISRHRA